MPTAPALTTKNRIGLGLAAVIGVADCVAYFLPTPEGDVGPPTEILVLGLVLGVVTLVAVPLAWRSGSRATIWTIVGARVLSALTALPVFVVDAPTATVLIISGFLVLTVVAVVLLLRRPAATDLE